MKRTAIVPMFALAAGLGLACNAGTVEHRADEDETRDDGELTKLAFDPAAVETKTGKVLEVEPFQKISGSRHGLRIQLQADDGVYYVYLGPQRYLEREGLTLKQGQDVEVTGSVLDGDGRPVIIASKITRDGTSVQLRDADGRPAWRGWKRWRRS